MPYDFEKTYKLIAQSPMIHFQPTDEGATLRATEVKPKLDRYLIRKAKEKNKPYQSWLIASKEKALNYKMHIFYDANEDADRNNFEDNRRGYKRKRKMVIGDFPIYYGGESKGITFRNCKLKIICFIPELLSFIKSNIHEFFVVTNFGTMQSKGFGSFLAAGMNYTENHFARFLCNAAGAQCCYMFKAEKNFPATFRKIKKIYSLMKSGINSPYSRSLLSLFMHKERGLGNEKAWLKQQGIAPIAGSHQYIENENNHQPYYVRALLGVGNNQEWLKPSLDPYDKAIISIECVTPDPQATTLDKNGNKRQLVERFPSPIFFKVIGDTVYYVARPIDERIFGCEFSFTSSNYPTQCNHGTLAVPPQDVLGGSIIEDFLEYCYDYKNDDFNFRESYSIRRYPVNGGRRR